MKHSRFKVNFLALASLALLLALSVPATSMAKDRHGKGRGRGDRDNWSWSKHDRKCAKFVNCHDASDGKRNRRGTRVGDFVWRNRNRNRVNNFNNSMLSRRQRSRRLRIDN
jgi:hypothetical protein